MIAATLPLAGGVLDGKTKDICSYAHELGHIVKGVWNRCCAAISFRLREVAELCRVCMGRSAQRRTEKARPSSSFGCNNADGRSKLLSQHSLEARNGSNCAVKFDSDRGLGREDDCFGSNYRNIHGAFLLWKAVRVATSRGGYSR